MNNQSIIPSTDVIQLTLALKMTTAQVVETSVTVNSPIQDYVHPTIKLNLLKWLLGSNLSQFFLSPTHRALIFIDEVYMTEISVNVLLALSKRGCTKKIYTINVRLQEALHCPFGDYKISLYTFRWLLFHCHCKRSRFFVWDSCKINQLDKNISRYCCHLLCWSSKSFPLKLKGSFFIPGASFLLFHAKKRQLQWDKFQK